MKRQGHNRHPRHQQSPTTTTTQCPSGSTRSARRRRPCAARGARANRRPGGASRARPRRRQRREARGTVRNGALRAGRVGRRSRWAATAIAVTIAEAADLDVAGGVSWTRGWARRGELRRDASPTRDRGRRIIPGGRAGPLRGLRAWIEAEAPHRRRPRRWASFTAIRPSPATARTRGPRLATGPLVPRRGRARGQHDRVLPRRRRRRRRHARRCPDLHAADAGQPRRDAGRGGPLQPAQGLARRDRRLEPRAERRGGRRDPRRRHRRLPRRAAAAPAATPTAAARAAAQPHAPGDRRRARVPDDARRRPVPDGPEHVPLRPRDVGGPDAVAPVPRSRGSG